MHKHSIAPISVRYHGKSNSRQTSQPQNPEYTREVLFRLMPLLRFEIRRQAPNDCTDDHFRPPVCDVARIHATINASFSLLSPIFTSTVLPFQKSDTTSPASLENSPVTARGIPQPDKHPATTVSGAFPDFSSGGASPIIRTTHSTAVPGNSPVTARGVPQLDKHPAPPISGTPPVLQGRVVADDPHPIPVPFREPPPRHRTGFHNRISIRRHRFPERPPRFSRGGSSPTIRTPFQYRREGTIVLRA